MLNKHIWRLYEKIEFDSAYSNLKTNYFAVKKKRDKEALRPLEAAQQQTDSAFIDHLDGRLNGKRNYHYIVIPGRLVQFVKIGVTSFNAKDLRDRYKYQYGPDILVCQYLIQNSK